MLHYINWQLTRIYDEVFIKNEVFGIKWVYFGIKSEWEFFLYPFLDTNHNTFYYAIFDNFFQYELFLRLVKISWIWVKTANYLVTKFVLDEIKQAINEADVSFFTQVPGIWPKTAKKILLELKDKLSLEELEKVNQTEELKEKIVRTLVNLGYWRQKVEKILKEYKNVENVSEVIKEIIGKIR